MSLECWRPGRKGHTEIRQRGLRPRYPSCSLRKCELSGLGLPISSIPVYLRTEDNLIGGILVLTFDISAPDSCTGREQSSVRHANSSPFFTCTPTWPSDPPGGQHLTLGITSLHGDCTLPVSCRSSPSAFLEFILVSLHLSPRYSSIYDICHLTALPAAPIYPLHLLLHLPSKKHLPPVANGLGDIQ